MKHASEVIAARYRTMLLERSGADRLKMVSGMFDDARALVRAGLCAAAGQSSEDIGVRVFRRLYSRDFDSPTLERIVVWLGGAARGAS